MAMTGAAAEGVSVDGIAVRRNDSTGIDGLFVYEVHDVERLLDVVVAEGGENPYGVLLWPCGLAMAHALHRERACLSGRRVVDVGAGVGLLALVAARAGAQVCALDLDRFARALIERAARDQALSVEVRPFDVKCDPLPDADLVVFSDLLYEPDLAVATARAVIAAHTRGAEVWVGDPGRYARRDFDARLRAAGLLDHDSWEPLAPPPTHPASRVARLRLRSQL